MKRMSKRRRAMFSDMKDRVSGKAAACTAGGGRGLIYRGLLLSVVMAGLMAALLAGGYRELPAHAQQTPTPTPTPGPTPDYSKVDDILNGRRHLLRTDDLFVASPSRDLYLTTANSQVTGGGELPASVSPGGPVVRSGRLFNLSYDVPVSLFLAVDEYLLVQLTDPMTGNRNPAIETQLIQNAHAVGSMELADFNGDGYSDVALSYRYPGQFGPYGMTIFTASDVNNFGAWLKKGPEYVDNVNAVDAMAIGDFNGDGQPEIAGISLKQASVELYVYTVNRQSLEISQASHLTLNIPEAANEPVRHISIASGRFTAEPHDQVIVAYGNNDATAKVKVIDFDTSSLQPQERTTWDTGSALGDCGFVNLKTGRLNWESPYDQAALLIATCDLGSRRLTTLSIDPGDFSVKQRGNVGISNYSCISDMALGNFDRMQQNPNPPPSTLRDPDLQVAVGWGNCANGTYENAYVSIYSVDPQTLGLTQAGNNFHFADNIPTFKLAAGDLQGRSLVLGEPEAKIVIEGTAQPTAVIAAPPMHVDFIAPVGQTQQTVLNISTVPEGFYATYDSDETSSNQSSSTNTTSWSFGAKESVTAGVTIGDPDVDGVKASDTLSAAQALKGSTENAHGTYSTNGFDVSQQTGIADQVWYSQTRFNIYVYPVIGQTVCPASKADENGNCADSEKVSLTVQFSGPDQISYETLSGRQLEWYQPPWEYGNVLSYPGSFSQLQQIVPDIQKLSQDRTWATDESVLTEKSTWAVGTSDSQSLSFKQNYSFENDFSVSGTVGIDGIGASFGASIDLSGSFGFSSLNKSSTDLGKSTGIGVRKPGSFLDPGNYSYFVTPYIFGRTQPGGSVDNIPLSGDIQTFGLLQTAFVVDPTRDDAGGWWKQAYTTAPDVALNHPTRWQVTTPGLTNPIPANCLATGTGSSQMDCVSLSPSYPNNPWVSEFHHMRGFFISSASSPGQGPQLETATAGDKLTLQARVHNYSLKAMSSGARVHVRFYGQEWNNSNNTTVGDSFLIGEDVLAPIPPFSSDPGAPLNWVFASASFDTTAYQDKYLVFWVVVWSQEADGTLTPEIADHGLTALPGAARSLADIQAESYSNNVGFYKMPFYVFAPPSGGGRTVTATQNEAGDVRLGRVRVSERRIEQGQATEVSVLLRTRAESVSGVHVVFYDGDPTEGGKAFDAEKIPHLRARDAHEVKVPYRSNTCGEHRIFVTVGKGKPYEATDASRPVTVKCAQPPQCTTNCFRSPQYYLNNLWGGLPRGEVWIAGTETPVSTRNVYAIGQALKGGQSAVKSFNREYVATQLSMLDAGLAGQRRREVLASTLACYGVSGENVVLSNGATIGPSTTWPEPLGQAERAARAGRRADLEKLAGVLGQLNSDDPGGSCLAVRP